jgi:hypothetical protein
MFLVTNHPVSSMSDRPLTVSVRLVFADEGTFHAEVVQVPTDRLGDYERLVDLLREEPSVTRQLYLDMARLVSAAVLDEG